MILLTVILGATILAFDLTKVEKEFFKARSQQNVQLMEKVISEIESQISSKKDSYLLTILAEAYMEYGLWGVDDSKKEETFQKALDIAKEAIELDKSNGRAYYVAGATIGRLAQYKGIVQSLFMLGDFDDYIEKAIKLLNDNFYKGLALIAMGMRYRDVPWPLNSYKKSEKYLKQALEILPNYPNIHLELGILYNKWKKYDLAKIELETVLNSPPHPAFVAKHEEAKAEAEKILKELK
ncbi:hypothetical protein JYK00_01070 [Thermosipho ferrireducens]|uniref:TPR repeat-containing protein n=1 Tax=Thermosipho ferrireducens TaxID=2571116 RepID=A0ABX7SBF9_9BACT|nr:hypothetical protein JYK00_01070 [Thermosipho ferrireducens]